ncbi:hypothetical protein O7626_10590 [Micromonospora sp. WMMD1102]|uniref:hypothetical protein n=1 Tax=Micromonospora sp. WMMD1102 TaxID=3016105 RepID=UPI002414EBD8|nr:hypothetical protein [Micromonospora sp. WMMD1102]MDG4786370.1 hypothetical protein [Micromonospora sp. WMMD1102]
MYHPDSGAHRRAPVLALRRPDGTVVLAGQAHDFATQYGSDALALRAARDGVPDALPPVPEWLSQLADLDPARVLFAHDGAVLKPVSSRRQAVPRLDPGRRPGTTSPVRRGPVGSRNARGQSV